MASSETNVRPAFHAITPDDRGPIIIIVAYSWIIITALVATIRFVLSWTQKLRVKNDDETFLSGAVLAIASSVCFHIAANDGLGKHIDAASADRLDGFNKALYAGELLAIAAQASAKTSVVFLSNRVAPQERRHYVFALATVACWAIFSFFAIALQGAPHPYVFNPPKWPTKGAMYYPIILFNILTDGFLAMWILPDIWKLHMSGRKKGAVVLLFSSRLLVAVFAILELVSVARHIRDTDVTNGSFGRILWTICVVHLSVILSTVPRTNRFMAALASGHANTLLTDFELAIPNGQIRAPPKDVSYATTAANSSSSGKDKDPAIQVPAAIAVTDGLNRSRSNSRQRSTSPSVSRSHRSEQPLVDAPLELTPSNDRQFRAHVVSPSQIPASGVNTRTKGTGNKFNTPDWKKYMRRSKNGEDVTMGSMFSWKSGRSVNAVERIEKTTEVKQEVEHVAPGQSKWVLRQPKRMQRERTRTPV